MLTRGSAFWVVPLVLGCAAPSRPPRPELPDVQVVADPPADLAAVGAVTRFRVTGLPANPSSLFLFEGDLSSYHVGRVRSGELPSTLQDRRIAAYAYAGSDGELVLAPSAPLPAGGSFTLAATGFGVLAKVGIEAEPSALYAARLFPPPEDPMGNRWIFCGALRSATPPASIVLEPEGLEATVAPGVDAAGSFADTCLHVDVVAVKEAVALPPPVISGVALDPSPLGVGTALPASGRAACESDEIPLGPGCGTVLDDRIVLRTEVGPLFWALRTGGAAMTKVTEGRTRFTWKGLPPDTAVSLTGSTSDVSGNEARLDVVVRTRTALPHVILSEVLANAAGAEPAQEWVELSNDGSLAVDLAGYALGDLASASPLPGGRLGPGEFALVVPDAYQPSDGADVPPTPGTLLIRVPRLGQNGLSNSGEKLRLLAPDGSVASTFPAVPAKDAGVSIARATPESPDEDTSGFSASASPGASPGASNRVAPPE